MQPITLNYMFLLGKQPNNSLKSDSTKLDFTSLGVFM